MAGFFLPVRFNIMDVVSSRMDAIEGIAWAISGADILEFSEGGLDWGVGRIKPSFHTVVKIPQNLP